MAILLHLLFAAPVAEFATVIVADPDADADLDPESTLTDSARGDQRFLIAPSGAAIVGAAGRVHASLRVEVYDARPLPPPPSPPWVHLGSGTFTTRSGMIRIESVIPSPRGLKVAVQRRTVEISVYENTAATDVDLPAASSDPFWLIRLASPIRQASDPASEAWIKAKMAQAPVRPLPPGVTPYRGDHPDQWKDR